MIARDAKSRVAVLQVDLAVEKAVLGSILLDNRVWRDVCGLLTASDFSITAHKAIWSTLGDLLSRGEPADYLTVSAALADGNENVTAVYITSLGEGCVISNTQAHARLVRKASRLRALCHVGAWLTKAASCPQACPELVLNQLQERLNEIVR